MAVKEFTDIDLGAQPLNRRAMKLAEGSGKQPAISISRGKQLICCLVMCAFVLTLTACGPTYLKPPIPNDVPLAPAVIYMPACVVAKSRTFPFQNLPSAENAKRAFAACTALRPVLQDRISKMPGRYTVREAERTGQSYLDIRPDLNAEKALHARYRIVLDSPYTFSLEVGTPPFTSRRVQTFEMKIGIYEIESGKLIGVSTLRPGANSIKTLTGILFIGLEGARCDPINPTSFTGLMEHPGFMCQTFSLKPPAP